MHCNLIKFVVLGGAGVCKPEFHRNPLYTRKYLEELAIGYSHIMYYTGPLVSTDSEQIPTDTKLLR